VGIPLLSASAALRLHVTGLQHWAAEGVAHAIAASALGAVWRVEVVALEDALAAGAPDVLVVVQPDAASVRRLLDCLPAALPVLWLGAAPHADAARPQGVLAADAGGERIAAAAHALAHGLHVSDRALALPPAASPLEAEPLTPRELQVLELMAKGLANREIAQALGISAHTAKFHVAQILEKMQAATRTEAVRQALRFGFIGL
jgi:DNA-binding CsgD family transcriptional regulator